LQRGFSKRVSPTNAALLLTEAIADAKDRKKKCFVAFIDASNAFDVVWHDSLMLKLFQSGVKDEDWFLVYKWYQHMRSRVKWDGQLSRAFDEQQGVIDKVVYYLLPCINIISIHY